MLTLFSTWGCHLCDDAQAMLEQSGAAFQTVDIVDDEQAMALFRTEIPVLYGAGLLLKWPFDAALLAEFIAAVQAASPSVSD